jgi:beta-1,4-mannosyl-glycoprotein beta-1,4-N-acetylglucosaminyltransferase
MKIADCFTFLNELELLDLRLMTLNDVVDYFIIVEANKTHTGKPKDFVFEANRDKYKEYLDKIIYIKVEDLPDYKRSDIWKAENFQRNCITRGTRGLLTSSDKMIVSDIDEIPNPEAILANKNESTVMVIEHILFYYYVNCIQRQTWYGSIMDFYSPKIEPQHLRHYARGMSDKIPRRKPLPIKKIIPGGGWHYSYMGGPAQVKYKTQNIAESHFIVDLVGTEEEIKHKMETQQDLWNRTESYAKKEIVDIKLPGMAPKCIGDFIKKYPHFYFGNYE